MKSFGSPTNAVVLAAFAATLWLSFSGVDGFLIKSKTDSAWGTSWNRDDATSRIFSISTIFKDGTNDVSMSGTADTDCLVLMGSASGIWLRTEFENVQVCAGGSVFLDDDDYPYTAVVGFTGNQPLLQLLGNVRDPDESVLNIPGPQWKLPLDNIPVDIAVAEPMTVLVALHKTNGRVFTSESAAATGYSTTLAGLNEHWKVMTNPEWLAEPQTLPSIVKMNALTGEVDFHFLMEVDGSATIAKVHYTQDYIVIAGSVQGVGDAFGNTESNDWDGYLTFIDPTIGFFIQDKPTIRLQSTGELPDDYVRDMCVLKNTAYVIGRTDGKFDSSGPHGGAFIIAIDLDTREVKWQTQIAEASKEAVTCVVSNTALFVAGHVQPGGGALQNMFFARVELDTGFVSWTKEGDTSQYQGDTRIDEVYYMEINAVGDINVLSNSIQPEEGRCDIIVMDVGAQDGDNDLDDILSGVTPAAPAATETEAPADASSSGSQMSTPDDDKKKQTTIIIATVVPLVLALLVAIYYFKTRGEKAQEFGEEKAAPKPTTTTTTTATDVDAPNTVV